MSGPAPVRVLFAGTPEVALPSLEALAADPRIELIGALTNPARPRGRHGAPVDPPVAVRARELGLPVLQPERPAQARTAIADLRADVGAVVAYGAILPMEVLALPRTGWVNLHLSLLPRWRGAAPVQHAVRAGDAVTGVTVFRLDEGMDTGPVLRRAEVAIPDDVDAGDLLDRLAALGAPLLVEGVLAAASGEPGTAQPATGVTLAPRIGPDDAVVTWAAPAVEVARAIRAVTPRPGASTVLDGRRLKVAGARTGGAPTVGAGSGATSGEAAPGTVLGADGPALLVACADGPVRIERLQPEGRRWTPGADILRGRLLAVGDVLGPAGGGGPRR